jgi:deoxycytidine triphosphate deaminase
MGNQLYGTSLRLLRGEDIKSAVKSGYLKIHPFDEAKLQPTSYDISVFQLIKFPSKQFYQAEDNEEIIEDFDEIIIEPGQSYLFLTFEEFSFPLDMIAEVSLRSRYSRLFNSSEYMGRVECGWRGRLVLEITNHSLTRRVRIQKGEALATVVIYQLEQPVIKGYTGRYLDWPNLKRR